MMKSIALTFLIFSTIILASAISLGAAADHSSIQSFQPMVSQIENTTLSQTTPFESFKPEQQQRIANIWLLSIEEYKHYRELMQNSPSQLWYQKLDPAEVLGLNASSDQERMKYALIEAKLDILRVSEELAYQRAYTEAVKNLLQDLQPIERSQGKTKSAKKSEQTIFNFSNP